MVGRSERMSESGSTFDDVFPPCQITWTFSGSQLKRSRGTRASAIFWNAISYGNSRVSSASKWDNQSRIVCFSLLVLFFLTVDVRRRLNQCVVASLTSENLLITLLQVCISHPSIIYVQFSICGQVFVEKESFLKWKFSERLTLLMLRIGTGHDLASLLRSDGRFDGACRYFSLASHHHRHRSSFYAELTVARPFLPSVWYSWRCKNEVRASRWWVAN